MSREIPLKPSKCALLIIDMQEYCARPGHGLFKNVDPNAISVEDQYFFDRMKVSTIPAIQNLLKAFREKKGSSEVIFTYIECLTKDGRDQSLDYKLSNFVVPKGSPDARIISSLQPDEDEILIPKTSCSVFNSTNVEYVLRNLGLSRGYNGDNGITGTRFSSITGVEQLVIAGIVTNQCVESAVRDAADRGFYVTLVEDAVATHTEQDHVQSLKNMKGFSRIVQSKQIVQEMKAWDQ